jgi:hypothetical protein
LLPKISELIEIERIMTATSPISTPYNPYQSNLINQQLTVQNQTLMLSHQNRILNLASRYLTELENGQVNPVATQQLANLAISINGGNGKLLNLSA